MIEHRDYKIEDDILVLFDSVTEIPDYEFCNNTNIKRIVFPKYLKRIGIGAFKNNINLRSVEIPDTVEYIGTAAFCNNISLEEVVLPKHLKSIYPRTFYNTRIKKIVFPTEIKIIADQAFEKAFDENTQRFNLPDSLEVIGLASFYNYQAIGKLPNNIRFCGDYKNSAEWISEKVVDHTSTSSYYIDDNTLYFNEGVTLIGFFGTNDYISKIVFPDSVEGILPNAFSLFTNLKSVSLPKNIRYIGFDALSSVSLDRCILPSTLEYCSVNPIRSNNIQIPHTAVYDEENQSFTKYYSLNILQSNEQLKNIGFDEESIIKNINSVANVDYYKKEKLSKELYKMIESDETNESEFTECILNGADVNYTNEHGVSLLCLAICKRKYNYAEILIKYGADYTKFDKNDLNMFFYFIINNNLVFVKYLIDMGYDVNLQNDLGTTALMIAAFINNLYMVKLLVENNAIINIENNKSQTAYDIANNYGHIEIRDYLSSRLDSIKNSEIEKENLELLLK